MPAPLIGLAVAAAKTATGVINNKKAKEEARILAATRPKYSISDESQEELDFAESEVGGLSSRAERAYANLSNQQFSSSLDAILKGGGSVNNIGSVFGASEEGRQRLSLLNDQLRIRQIDDLTRARRNMTEQQDKKFEFNEWRPWADAAQANASSREQAQKDIWGGLETGAAIGMQAFGESYNKKQYEKMLTNVFSAPTSSGGENKATMFSIPTLNPAAMGAGRTSPTVRRQQFTQPMSMEYRDDYWSPEQERNSFRNDFGLNYY